MKELTLQAIQDKYPHPVTGKNSNMGGYCVGGAFCLSLEGIEPYHAYRFPSAWQLARRFAAYNDDETAWEERRKKYLAFADAITALNDGELFEEAWALLGQFLLQNNRGNRDEQRL